MHKTLAKTVLCGALLAAGSLGQERVSPPPGEAVTLEEAAAFATKNYPAIRASLAEVAAAGVGIELARTAYLPRADLLLGFNRATRNNVFGLILPNGVIPAISGPVQDESTYTSTFGSAAGALLSWEPVGEIGGDRGQLPNSETYLTQSGILSLRIVDPCALISTP